MKMNWIVKKIRMKFFPTKWEQEVQKYFADGGDDHFRYDFDLHDQSIVFDLGGYKGQWASDIYSRYNCRILVFEPVSYFANKIKEKFKKNAKIETYCLALGANKREEGIGICADGSSIFTASQEMQTIEFEDVASFFNQFNIGEVDLMKINIEGGEYELLTRLIETGLIKQIKQLQIQFHNLEADSEFKMNTICENLALSHKPTFQYKFVWENWVRV